MNDPYTERIKHLSQAVLSGPGQLDATLRQAAASSGTVPAELESYVQKVTRSAYRVTDEDVAALLQAGYSEDQIFELTVCIALGAGLARLKAGQAALAAGGNDATPKS
jgi:alkylhydroperoxidase family enzyme